MLSVGGLVTTGFLRGQVYPDTVILAARHGLVQVDSLEAVVTWRPTSYVMVSVFSTLSDDDLSLTSCYVSLTPC